MINEVVVVDKQLDGWLVLAAFHRTRWKVETIVESDLYYGRRCV